MIRLHQNRKIKTIRAVIVFCAIAIIVLVLKNLHSMRDVANEVEGKRSLAAAEAVIGSLKRELAALAYGSSTWVRTSEALTLPNDASWIYDTWGDKSLAMAYDGVVVLDQDDNQVGAFLRSVKFDGILAFGTTLKKQARQAKENPEAGPTVNFFRYGDSIALIATTPIGLPPVSKEAPPEYTLSLIKLIDTSLLKSNALYFDQRYISLSLKYNTNKVQIPIRDIERSILGYVNWSPDYPGSIAYKNIEPQINATFFILFMLISSMLAYRIVEIRHLKLIASEARKIAMHDSLTGLLNRRGLFEAAERMTHTQFAVLLVDLDGFKAVNDTWGHPVGDELIQMVGRKLVSLDQSVTIVSRLGGDEFALIQTGNNDPKELGKKIVSLIAEPFIIGGEKMKVGASVGIAAKSGDQTINEVIRRADIALYRAKNTGRNQAVAYTEEPLTSKPLDRERPRGIAAA